MHHGVGQWRTKQAGSDCYLLQSTNFHHEERCFQEPQGRGGKGHSFAMHQPPCADGERRVEYRESHEQAGKDARHRDWQ